MDVVFPPFYCKKKGCNADVDCHGVCDGPGVEDCLGVCDGTSVEEECAVAVVDVVVIASSVVGGVVAILVVVMGYYYCYRKKKENARHEKELLHTCDDKPEYGTHHNETVQSGQRIFTGAKYRKMLEDKGKFFF